MGEALGALNDNNDEMNEMILSNLVNNSEYFIKVFPHLQPEYFPEGSYRDIFKVVDIFYKKHEGRPTKLAINLELNSMGYPEERFNNAKSMLNRLSPIQGEDLEIMIKQSEEHIKKKAYLNTIMDVLEIYENEKKSPETRNHKLPSLDSTNEMVAKALAISFENKLGHDYNKGFAQRLESYLKGVVKIPFRLNGMNLMTEGGVERKTLNIPIAPTGVGKSMFLCSIASDYLMMGYNVLYITLEMGEMAVSKRIDANLLDISLKNLKKETIDSDLYMKKAHDFMEMPHIGSLKIKEYGSKSATTNDFCSLIEDYKVKENFVPDIVIVDYLMIVKPRGKISRKVHEELNEIAVELRALAFKYDVAVWSPMQTNRDGVDKSDLSLSDIAGSYDVSTHADFIIIIIETEDGVDRRIQRIKTVKNRYGSKDENNSLELFVTKGKQRYEDMGEYNTSPPNVPPTLAFASSPMIIADDKVVMQETKKEPTRKMFYSSDNDDSKDLNAMLDQFKW